MVFGKEKLILLEGEEFDEFMNNFGYAWDEGWSAKKIAEELGFGTKGTWAEKLKPHHCYYLASHYSEAYGLEPRRKQKKEASQGGVPYLPDMPTETVSYLKDRGLLIE